jgi:hypothetical protein
MFSNTNLIAQEEIKLGKDLTLIETTKISDLLAEPQKYLDNIVLIKGEVLDVCSMAGCWMEIKSDKTNQKIKVKVKDGDIVFPVEAKGHTALVEGKVYKIEMDREMAIEYYEHEAEEKGVEFDSTKITGPITIYQVKGIGAVIQGMK